MVAGHLEANQVSKRELARIVTVFGLAEHLDMRLDRLERRLSLMAMTMAQLDAELTTWEAANDAAIAEVQTAVNDILAKQAAGADTTPEITRLQAGIQKLTAAADIIKGLDTTPPPGPTP